MAARKSSNCAASTGNSPQNTTGIAGRKPGSAAAAGLRSSVMVSPTRVSATSLMDAVALLDGAVDHAHEHDDAEIGVVPAVDEERLEGGAAVALGRRQPRDDRL